ncbi:MAG: Hypothetical protein AJITA_00812 [Acetilactobacillus jinshanensis]
MAPIYDGLTYKYDKDNNSIEFTNGTIGFNTSKVTNMSDMFGNDSSLHRFNLGTKFDTSKVTNMSGMFGNDNKLQSLTLPNSFDTSKVTNMNNMFSDSSLKSLSR